MPSEKSRSKAMVLVARTDGVSSMEIAGDGKDQLVVVGVDVDTVCLVMCLRKKLGYADILKVEEVKDKKPPEGPKVVDPLPYYCPCYYGYYCHHHNNPWC
ncbi:Copper transport protein family [Zea mays]|nr:Copper transport protein family [Zea mays]